MLGILDCRVDSKVEIRRIGKVLKDKPRLLRVKFSDNISRDAVLRRSKYLRNSKYKDVYINKDLTPLQQTEQHALREELRRRRSRNEDVVIYDDKLVLRATLMKSSRSTHFPNRF